MAATAGTAAPGPVLGFLGDERLARLAARGDRRAFDALFARHQPGVARYCRGILRNDADADDAAQNAMVAAHRSLEAGTVPMRVKPWLYRIAHNEAISLARRRRPEAELEESALPTVGGPDEVSAVRERLGQLLIDLQALSERQRQALVLRELYDFSYAEVATTLGCSEAAAQQTVFEARSSLQHFAAGRSLACEGVQRAMSACDGQRLRTRSVRAHVRGCSVCADFEHALRLRRRDLRLLFPPVSGAGGLLALLGGVGAKQVAIGLMVLAGGGAVAGVVDRPDAAPRAGSPAVVASPHGAVAGARVSSQGGGGGGTGGRVTRRSVGSRGGHAARHGHASRGGHGSSGGHGSTSGPASGAASSGDASGPAAATTPSDGGSGSSADAASGERASAPTSGGNGGTARHGLPPADSVKSTVTDTASTVTGAVSDTAASATQAVQDTAQQVTDTASGAVDTATQAAGDAAGTATNAVGSATQHLPPVP